MALLTLEDISAGYGDEPDILRDVSLVLQPHEKIFIVGSNGEGKSTLLKAAAGLLKLRAGRRIFSGQKAPGFLFQDPSRQLLCSTVREEIEFTLRISGTNADDVAARTDRLLREFVLIEFDTMSPLQLSGGQQQRLALSALMASSPELMLLDEPDAFLDGKSRREFRRFYFDNIPCATIWTVSRLSEIPEGYRAYELSRGELNELAHH